MVLADARTLLSFNATTPQPTTFRQQDLIRRSRILYLRHDDPGLRGGWLHGVSPTQSGCIVYRDLINSLDQNCRETAAVFLFEDRPGYRHA